jgi:hypothetical protein
MLPSDQKPEIQFDGIFEGLGVQPQYTFGKTTFPSASKHFETSSTQSRCTGDEDRQSKIKNLRPIYQNGNPRLCLTPLVMT